MQPIGAVEAAGTGAPRGADVVETFASPAPLTIRRRPVKRLLDLALASIFLLGLLVIVPFILLAVKLDSRGPSMFRQWRVGRGGRLIPMYKFRTMHVDAEARLHANPELHEEWVANDFKLPDDRDPRVTRVGRVLRRTSMDELPQVLNVLAGHMSMVGPRPIEAAQVDALYGDQTSVYLSVAPGLTGLWQVSGRSKISGDARVQLDAEYVDNVSLWLDVKILCRTIPAVLRAEGAH